MDHNRCWIWLRINCLLVEMDMIGNSEPSFINLIFVISSLTITEYRITEKVLEFKVHQGDKVTFGNRAEPRSLFLSRIVIFYLIIDRYSCT